MSSMRWYPILRNSTAKRNFLSKLRAYNLKSLENYAPQSTKISCAHLCSTSTSNFDNPSDHQKLIISTFILARDEAEYEEWSKCRKEVLQFSEEGLDDGNIDFAILERCLVLGKKLPLARSYLNYMRRIAKKIDGAVACEFLKLCYAHRTSLSEGDFDRIISFTNFLRKKYTKNMDSFIGEGVIKGLILQNKIDDCVQTLNDIKGWDQVNEHTYTAVIMYLIENNLLTHLNDLIVEFTAQYPLSRKLCSTWIKHFSKSRTQLDQLLTVFRRLSYRPDKNLCDYLLRSYQSLHNPEKLDGEYGIITDNGQCSVCGESLNRIRMKDDELETLKKSFTSNALIGSNIYVHTKPYELEKFHTLLDVHGPFGIIIDGLNVAYRLGSSGSSSTYVQGIEKVFTQLRHHSPSVKIMFIGKWHMRKWPGLLDKIRHFDARYFFVENDSADDMYIVSAALHSKAFLVSNDALGKEKLRLNREEFDLFERWRQISVISVKKRANATVELSFPFPFEKVVQSARGGGWHVPYYVKSEKSSHWLCLRPAESL